VAASKRSPTSNNNKKSGLGFAKKLPLLRRSKSSKEVRSTTLEGATSCHVSSSSPDRITPRSLLQLQREELERHTAATSHQGLAKWSEMLHAEEKHRRRQRHRNKDKVTHDWVAGKPRRCNSHGHDSDDDDDDAHDHDHHLSLDTQVEPSVALSHVMGGQHRGGGAGSRREQRAAVVEALALSPRAADGYGGPQFSERRARAQLAALPYALTTFESRDR
jgi:hypothetical protein